MDSKKAICRLTGSKRLSLGEWPEEYHLNIGPDEIRTVALKMQRVTCTDCKGYGIITLFTSDAECDRCLGIGFYYEGFESEG